MKNKLFQQNVCVCWNKKSINNVISTIYWLIKIYLKGPLSELLFLLPSEYHFIQFYADYVFLLFIQDTPKRKIKINWRQKVLPTYWRKIKNNLASLEDIKLLNASSYMPFRYNQIKQLTLPISLPWLQSRYNTEMAIYKNWD